MTFTTEVRSGQRFEFGKNWRRFLSDMRDEQIAEAETAMVAMLGDIEGKTFLDAGCGSGLFSLAAHRLGAKVHSFDYDPASVACTMELQRMFGGLWPVEEGSVLDREYLDRLGTFDIVYSWGVLHHTGNMHQAFKNIARLVSPGGVLFISIYNDQGWKSRLWLRVKRLYNAHSLMRTIVGPMLGLARVAFHAIARKANARRGMSIYYDMIDWLGGYPYEFATPETVMHAFQGFGFTLADLRTVRGKLGPNEFVFLKHVAQRPAAPTQS